VAIVESNTELGRQVVADAKQFVLHSWSVQDALEPVPVAGGEGRYFWDYDGKRYLDFASQLVNVSIGHQHPKVVAAIKEQADKLCTIGPPMATEPRSTLARMLAEITPGDLTMSFFTNGGAEANENAIKLARWYTGRHKVIARYRSYHGATAGAITLTGDPRRWPAEPGISGVVRMLDPYTYRCPAGHPDPCPVCTGAPHLEEILQYEGAHTVAAVILETVTGTNGIIVPPDGYLQSIRKVCDRHGILLIADEVMAGFGRTGKWFGVENWHVVPDIISLAKGINSGYVPIGAMVVREPIANWVRDKYFAGGLTYSGHPLACASAIASIEAFKEEGIVENAAEMGGVFAEQLRGLEERHPSIGDVRGLGCFWGIELVKDRKTREPLVPFNASGEAFTPVARVSKAAIERGLYLMTHWNVIMVCPPLTITREEIEEGISILDEALIVADEYAA
jgi:taurine--2-oxoglutarate transaminase